MENSKTLFTIGQFAQLHGINKKTLMWYDEVGILKPAVIKENNYRYYSYSQSTVLETILLLRDLDVSISEIRSFLKNRSAANLELLLEERIAEVDQTILRLKAMQKALISRKESAAFLVNTDFSKIEVVETKPQYLAVIEISKNVPFEKEIGLIIEEAKRQQLGRLHNAVYGSMISVENLYNGEFDDYSAYFMKLQNPAVKKGLYRRPGGRCLRAFCKGDWSRLPERYREIMEYAKSNGLSLGGYAYETGINDILIDSVEEYLTQIEIPVAGTG